MNDSADEVSNTIRLVDTCVAPFIICFGLLTNLGSIVIYSKIKKKSEIQQVNSICSVLHFAYLLILFMREFLLNLYFDIKSTWFANWFDLYFTDYLSSALAIDIICVQIFIFYKHYLLTISKQNVFTYSNCK